MNPLARARPALFGCVVVSSKQNARLCFSWSTSLLFQRGTEKRGSSEKQRARTLVEKPPVTMKDNPTDALYYYYCVLLSDREPTLRMRVATRQENTTTPRKIITRPMTYYSFSSLSLLFFISTLSSSRDDFGMRARFERVQTL